MRAIAISAILLLATAQDEGVIPANANLVVYRDHAEPKIWPATLSIDGKKVASLGQKTFTAVHLRPGNHGFDLDWPVLSGQISPYGTFTITEGQVIYLEVTGTSRVVGVDMGTIKIRMGSGVELRDETAVAVIAKCCKFKPPRP